MLVGKMSYNKKNIKINIMKDMRSIKIIPLLFIIALFGMVSCQNDPITFDDYTNPLTGTKLTACYFPYQSPARTLILGKYDVGLNTNDNNHIFEIGAIMSGVQANTKERKVYFQVDNTLLDSVKNVTALPVSYYTIQTASPAIIPAGSTKAIITIHLEDAFFNDPKSFAPTQNTNYVVPLRIISVEGLDTILVGKLASGITLPIRGRAANWSIQPKDFTLFGIKFINKYHGNYLRRGVDSLSTLVGGVYTYNSKVLYHNPYVERDEVTKLTTSAKDSVTFSNAIRRAVGGNPGTKSMKLSFDANGNCVVVDVATKLAIGTGTFKDNGDMWGGKSQDVIYLNYSYIDIANSQKHVVRDTMVIRDRAIVFETFTIVN